MAAKYDLNIDQGASESLLITWKDNLGGLVNNTGFSAKLQIRERLGSDPLVTLTEIGGITLGGVDGTILIELTDAQTANLPDGECIYDLLITTAAGTKKRLLEGSVYTAGRVTV